MKIIAKGNPKFKPQMEIWERIKKKKSTTQREIWELTGKKTKPKIDKIKDRLKNNIEKTRKAQSSVSKKIKELSTKYAELKKRQDPRYPNDYLNKRIVETLSKLKVYGTTKKMLSRLDNTSINLEALTTQINSNVQKLFKSEKNNNTQKEILNTLNSLTKSITSGDIDSLDRRELFLDFTKNIRQLHITLYETHVSRGSLISKFNKIMDNILGK